MRIRPALLSLALILGLTPAIGCNESVIAGFVSVIGTTSAQVALAQGHETASRAIEIAATNASAEIAKWKAGGKVEDAIQAFGILEKLALAEINMLAPNSPLQTYAIIISAGIDSVLALLPQPADTVSASVASGRVVVPATPPMKDASEMKRQWNAVLGIRPVAGIVAVQ